MRLQVGPAVIAAVAYDLECRFRESLVFSVGPVGEAQVEVSVCQHVAAGKEELSVHLEGIAQSHFVGGEVFLAEQVDEVQAVEDILVGIVYFVGIVGCHLLLSDGVEHNPSAQFVLHLHLHELVEFAVCVVPCETRLARRERFPRELRRTVLRRCGRHEVVLAVVAKVGVDAGIVLASLGEGAVLIELRWVALEVPVVIALDAVVVVHDGTDALQHLGILTFADSAGEGAVAVPRSAPHPLGNPDRPAGGVRPVLDGAEVAFGPIAMQVDDVAAPSASVDAVDEALQVACSVGIVAAVPRRGGAQTHACSHKVLPVGKHGIHVLRLSLGVVGSVHGLVVGLHVRRGGAGSKAGRRRIVLVDVVRHVLNVGRHVAGCAPGVGAGDVQGRTGILVAACGSQLRLAGIVPAEDAVGGYLAVEHSRQRGHFQVGIGCDEAAAVAPSGSSRGEGDHVAALELEGTDAVVQLPFGEGVHVAA